MTRSLMSLSVCVALTTAAVSDLWACGPRSCANGAGARPTVVRPVRPGAGTPVPAPTVGETSGPSVTESGGDTQVVWDLPETEKARIRQAVRLRTAPETASAPAAPTAPAAADSPVVPERVARAVAAQKAIAAQMARLLAKRAEIQRWDEVAQAKFRQAFGSTDEPVRARVMQRINQQIQEGSRLMAALADTISFEFYVAQKKK